MLKLLEENDKLTAAILLVAEIAPTVRLDCRRAFLNIVATAQQQRIRKVEELSIQLAGSQSVVMKFNGDDKALSVVVVRGG